MSVQFGRWNFDGQPCATELFEKVRATLVPYGPDSAESYAQAGVQILYCAFHTTKESRRETQPHISQSGAVFTWDGQLDNRAELIGELHEVPATSTDVELVAAAFERWGHNCFARLLGDWALSIWNPVNRTLLLAKDPVGTRHLYYWFDRNQVSWSSILDPLVRFAGRTFDICEEYIAAWLSITMYPATHLTPCVDVHAVPPSSFVLLRTGKHSTTKYWDFDGSKVIRYRTDAEYEEHFRAAFTKAVKRKLRSDSPVLAELSGGRDSSSIVCVADAIIAKNEAECPRLDTISYYDDLEPNWNERPYFTKVEEKRGRTGWHVDVNARDNQQTNESESPDETSGLRFEQTPGYHGRTSLDLKNCLITQGNRVLLSGIGGDETMGGVPSPGPELENLIARAQFRKLAHQLKVWALQLKKPWIHLFWDAAREFLPLWLVGAPSHIRPAPWLRRKFVRHHQRALIGYHTRTKFFGPLPSFQSGLVTLEGMRKQLARTALPFQPPYEKRYPFLDRELMEFMFAIPRDQVVRPAQRRSLMRRALAGIVPDEILNRKTKAYVERAQMVELSRDWTKYIAATQHMALSSLGIVDPELVSEALQKARRGEDVPMISLMRIFLIEGWLKQLRALGVVNVGALGKPALAWQTS